MKSVNKQLLEKPRKSDSFTQGQAQAQLWSPMLQRGKGRFLMQVAQSGSVQRRMGSPGSFRSALILTLHVELKSMRSSKQQSLQSCSHCSPAPSPTSQACG